MLRQPGLGRAACVSCSCRSTAVVCRHRMLPSRTGLSPIQRGWPRGLASRMAMFLEGNIRDGHQTPQGPQLDIPDGLDPSTVVSLLWQPAIVRPSVLMADVRVRPRLTDPSCAL